MQVLAEFDQLYAASWRGPVFIVDDNFIGNRVRVRDLLLAMTEWQRAREYPFRFITEASVNLADDRELLQSMKDAGFTSVFLGIETPDESSLKATNMLQNTRLSYWKFLFSAATRHRRSFGAALTLAVTGYHFQIITEQLEQVNA